MSLVGFSRGGRLRGALQKFGRVLPQADGSAATGGGIESVNEAAVVEDHFKTAFNWRPTCRIASKASF